MKKLIFIALFILISYAYAEKVIVLNSNSNIEKYKSVQEEFIKNTNDLYEILNIANMSHKDIKEYLYDEYPDIIYTIGSKAYAYTNMYIPEKTIFFSSIINYKRLDLNQNRYGVSNELHSGMNLTLIKSLFNETKSLNIIYSEYTKDLFEDFKQNARKIGLNIKGQKISKNTEINKEYLKSNDGLILIADPILLKDEDIVKDLFAEMKELKKPVFAYHELFIKFGAALVVSADNPTVGRQVASMIESYKDKKEFIPKQLPMGTNVIFNKKISDELNLKYNEQAFSVVNKVVE